MAGRERGVPPTLEGHVPAETAERSREYTLAKGRLGLVSMALSSAVTLIALFSGILPWLDRALSALGLRGANLFVGYLVVLGLAAAVLGAPALALRDLRRSRPASASTGARCAPGWPTAARASASRSGWASRPVGRVALHGFSGALWWLWLFAFLPPSRWSSSGLYPSVIAPIFNRFEPLARGSSGID